MCVFVTAGALLTSQSLGNGAHLQAIKRLEREAESSPPYSADVKNKWNYISTPYRVFRKRILISPLTKGQTRQCIEDN